MKRMVSVILAAVLMCLCLTPAMAVTNAKTEFMESTGVSFTYTEAMEKAKGTFQMIDYGGVSGSSVTMSYVVYLPKSEEEIAALSAAMEELSLKYEQEPNDEVLEKFYETYFELMGSMAPVCAFMTVSGGKTLEDVREEILGSDSEKYYRTYPIGTVGENSCYLVQFLEDCEEYQGLTIPDEYRAEFDAAGADTDSIIAHVSLKEPVEETLLFSATDLDGNPVNLQDVYAEHAVTMVNIWATWCGPCYNEMPSLEALSREMANQDCAIIGICTDAKKGNTENAKAILAETGVTYLNVFISEEDLNKLNIIYFPTSYFVNREGKIVTDRVEGISLESYRNMFEKALEQ